MTENSLKAVLSFDPETAAFKPFAHNLTPEQAVEKMQKQDSVGTTVRIVDQENRHRTVSTDKCKSCKRLVELAWN